MSDSTKNQITLDYSASPSLAAAIAGKSPGDSVELEVKFTIQDVNDTVVTGSIDEVNVEEEDPATEVDSSSPVMIVMAKTDKKDSGKTTY